MDVPTQDFLQIQDIREGVIILKNGALRGLLGVRPINFVLRSEEEQSYVTSAFQSFLNSLDFSCQIVVQSRHLNITPYLDSIRRLEEQQTEELLKLQTASYREFIQELVQTNRIMTKRFYVVVSYTIAEALGVGAAVKKSGLFNLLGGAEGERRLSPEEFVKCHKLLLQRMEFAAAGLRRCELEVLPLNSEEVIELLWSTYHPAEAESGHAPIIAPELLR